MIDKIVEALEAAPPTDDQTGPGCYYLGRISYLLAAVAIVILFIR